MLIKSLVITVVTFAVSFTPEVNRAQDNLPPVLDPADIFTDAVEVVETLPILNADDATRTLDYFDPVANTWTTFPYPAELREMSDWRFEAYTGGRYLISKLWLLYVVTPDDVLIFDPATGEFTQPDSVCGRMKALPGQGRWVLYQDPTTLLYRLCFTETGDLSVPFPPEISTRICDFWRAPPTTSPKGEWIVFSDCNYPDVGLYSYNVTTGKVNYLGSTTGGDSENVSVAHWLDDDFVVFHIDALRSQSFRSVYVAKMSQPNSLQLIVSQYRFWPSYFPDPPRYEWVPGEYLRGAIAEDASKEEIEAHAQFQCGLHVYDLQTRKETNYPYVRGVCATGVTIPGGNGDRLDRTFSFPDSGLPVSATLVRFNPETHERSDLFSGEIEYLYNTSPDGRYAALVMDRDGVIDLYFAGDMVDIFETMLPEGYFAIFDLTLKQIVYEAKSQFDYTTQSLTLLDWIDDDTFLVTNTDYDERNKSYLSRLVTTEGREVKEFVVDQIGTPLAGRAPVTRRQGDNTEISLFDGETNSFTPITKSFSPRRYKFHLDWLAEDTLSVSVVDATRAEYFELARWRVRV